MSRKIFVVNQNQKIVSLHQEAYESEDLLQYLLAEYPEVLAPDQIGNVPRKWLLVSREAPVPGSESDVTGRWSLDHLFLDQDGIPTLVEVKRSTDTRIRREVVGQMLDYGANAVAYWNVDQIRTRFESQLGEVDAAQVLEDRLGITSVDVFWQMVTTNLQAGKIRMIFVADEIPDELRRIVEFLNEQMSPAEVLAIAIRQYVGENLKTLVPTLYGHTAKAEGIKSQQPKRKWSEDTFFPELAQQRTQQEAHIAYKLLEWVYSRNLRVWWGEGKQYGSFLPLLDVGEQSHFIVSVWTYGTIEVQFQHMISRPPFDDERLRDEFRVRLNQIPGVALPEDSISRRPGIPLNALATDEHLQAFLRELDWFIETVLKYYA